MTRSKRAPDFEKSITELETLVETLEAGDLSLEESLKAFERGVRLTRECQTALETAETKVEILLQQSGGERLQAFEDGTADEEVDGEDADCDEDAN
jgi:exodeoxyribonuclease VII small subunit